MTVGAGGGLNVVLKALLDPGDEVVIFSPFFVEYRFYIENHGGKMVLIQTDPETFLPDAAALERHINEKTKAVILNSPNNPTGVVYDRATLGALEYVLRRAEKRRGKPIYVISDEPYRDVVYDGVELPSMLGMFKNAIVVYSFSKSLSLPGERIGYIAASDKIDCIDLLMDALVFANRSLGFVNAPALYQRVIGESLGATVDINIYKERRDMLYDHITELGFSCIKPQGAFYLFPKSPLDDAAELKKAAVNRRIIFVPGGGFGCPTHFRLAYCVGLETIKNSLDAFTALAEDIGLR
jgi:aspartate aminotransferase